MSSPSSTVWLRISVSGVAGLALWRLLRSLCSKEQLPHRPLAWPVVGNTLAFIKDPTEFISKGLASLNGSFRASLLFQEVVVLHPTAANLKLFMTQRDLGWPPHFLDVVGRTSLPMVNDPMHKRMRTVSGRAFTSQNLDSYLPVMQDCTKRHLEMWLSWKGAQDVQDAVRLYTFELAQRIILGLDVSAEETLTCKKLFVTATSGLGCVLPFDIPGFYFRKCMNARRELVAKYQSIIDQKRTQPPKMPESMLDHVLLGGSVEGSDPSDVELQDFCFAMQFAGHDTTLASMQTMLHYLDENPQVTEQLRREVRCTWDGQKPITRSLLQQIHKCRAFAAECMRLTPPIQTVSRTLGAASTVDGYPVKPGITLYLGTKSITDESMKGNMICLENHLDADGSYIDRSHEFSKIAAFGCGGRMCIGYKFASDEISIFLLTFRFRVESRERITFPFHFWRVKVSLSKETDTT